MVPGNTIAPNLGAPQAVIDRLAPTAALGHAAETDLGPAKSVTQVAPAAAARNDTSPQSDLLQHTVRLDPATQELIFRVVDTRTRQVVRQIPEEALLRMRAYAQALNQGKSTAAALNLANLEA
jgi:hypothetical protein